MRVVLADADERMRAVVRFALAGHAVVVAEVASASQCLAAVEEYRPDAVLVADDLPDYSGRETLALLLRRSASPPRVLLLGAVKPSSASDPRTVGYLSLPFDAHDLISQMDRLMASPARLHRAKLRENEKGAGR